MLLLLLYHLVIAIQQAGRGWMLEPFYLILINSIIVLWYYCLINYLYEYLLRYCDIIYCYVRWKALCCPSTCSVVTYPINVWVTADRWTSRWDRQVVPVFWHTGKRFVILWGESFHHVETRPSDLSRSSLHWHSSISFWTQTNIWTWINTEESPPTYRH